MAEYKNKEKDIINCEEQDITFPRCYFAEIGK